MLLRIGDVGAARNQLELVADEAGDAAGVTIIAHIRCSAVWNRRSDARIWRSGTCRSPRTAPPDWRTESLLRLLLCGVLLADNRRYAPLAMLDDVRTGKYGPVPDGQGTLARLHRLLPLSQRPPFGMNVRAELRYELRCLPERHPSAAWMLLVTSMCAGPSGGAAEEQTDSYAVLIETAAGVRCRYMDGAADLCDRQLATLLAPV